MTPRRHPRICLVMPSSSSSSSSSRGQSTSRLFHCTAIICILVVFVLGAAEALVYCPLDKAYIPDEGYPLPIPLPRDGSVRTSVASNRDFERGYYECPSKTHCCPKNQCCPIKFDDNLNSSGDGDLLGIDKGLRSVVAFVVLGTCLLISALLLVCCFWTPCPLSNSCRVRYTRDDAGCADKMGELPEYLDTMPCEETPLRNTFLINHFFQRKDKDSLQGQEVAV